MRREWVDAVMEIGGIQLSRGMSYIETLLTILEPGEVFTAPSLVTRSGIPRTKIYGIIKKYPWFFEEMPTHQFPVEYKYYSVLRRVRYRVENNLSHRGKIPARYRFTADTTKLQETIEERIDTIVNEAVDETTRLRKLQRILSPTTIPATQEKEAIIT